MISNSFEQGENVFATRRIAHPPCCDGSPSRVSLFDGMTLMTYFAEPIRGIVPPMITPLKGADQLDHEGLERLISLQIDAGVAGLFILGTTGEGPSLSY